MAQFNDADLEIVFRQVELWFLQYFLRKACFSYYFITEHF